MQYLHPIKRAMNVEYEEKEKKSLYKFYTETKLNMNLNYILSPKSKVY